MVKLSHPYMSTGETIALTRQAFVSKAVSLLFSTLGFPGGSVVNPPAMQETWVQSLGWGDLLEKEMATHSSILAWKIPRMEEPGRLQSMGSRRVEHD